jgi:ATP adenylyltransferase
MEYIRGTREPGCIFCDYPAEGPDKRRERLLLCERPDAFVMLNRYPFASSHVMVVPTRHVSDLGELTPDEHAALFELVRAACGALRVAVRAEGLNVGLNLGAAAGAGIAEHLHVHVVPRWRGDHNFMPVIADVRVMPEALDATWAHLEPFFRPLAAKAHARPAKRP